MSRNVLFPSLAVLAVLVGCAGARPPLVRDIERTSEVSGVGFDAVWEALLALADEHEWNLDEVDRARGVIMSENHDPRYVTAQIVFGEIPDLYTRSFELDSAMDCGTEGWNEMYREREVSIVITVRGTATGASITVDAAGRAYVWNGFTDRPMGRTVACASTGVLEKALADEIRRRLN